MTGGCLYTLSAPSGAGKTSLVRALLDNDDQLTLSISHTTRPRRTGEADGVDYFFVDDPAFDGMIANGEFLEYARVFDNRYGTSAPVVEETLAGGRDVLLEIDWQGARQVRERVAGAVSIFVLPPSREALVERLRGRGQDADEVIERRMEAAIDEMAHYTEADYLIVNDDFGEALADLRAIIRAGRARRPRQAARCADLIAELLAPADGIR